MLLILFPVLVVAGNLLTLCFKSSHFFVCWNVLHLGLLGLIICVNVTLLLHDWNVPRSFAPWFAIMKIHTFLKTLTYNALLFLKEYQDHQSNLAWWSGNLEHQKIWMGCALPTFPGNFGQNLWSNSVWLRFCIGPFLVHGHISCSSCSSCG